LTPDELGFRLRHVGVAVAALEPAAEALADLFGYRVVSGPFDDPIQKVRVNFLAKSDTDLAEIELIAPLGEESPITAMLAKSSGAAYHLCFETTDIDQALVHAKNCGCLVVSRPVPAIAFGGRKIAWIMTRSRQLFELVEAAVQPHATPL